MTCYVSPLSAIQGRDWRGMGAGAERAAGNVMAGMQMRQDAAVELERSRTSRVFFGGKMTSFANRLPSGKAGSQKSSTDESECECALSSEENS